MAECQAIGIRVSTSKPEGMDITCKKVNYTFWVQDALLSREDNFNYLKVLLTSEGRTKYEVHRQIGTVTAVMQSWYIIKSSMIIKMMDILYIV